MSKTMVSPTVQTSQEALFERIWELKRAFGRELIILGHHYQRDEVIQFADFVGDSFKLSQQAAQVEEAKYILFAGVHFMAESAAVLNPPDRAVLLPNPQAGCAMADMARDARVMRAWEELIAVLGDPQTVMPVTYMNSTAALKAFVGRQGGAVCTSSNAETVLRWAWDQRPKVFFFPDQHLGRNVAKRLGVALEEMVVWNPARPLGGLSPEEIQRARLILWKGHCPVHMQFLPEHVARWRQQVPDIRIMVHPECKMEVVDQADLVGSTEFIVRQVRQAPPGTKWAIGTEVNLVRRLQKQHPEQEIHLLTPYPAQCVNMARNRPEDVLTVLEALHRGEVIHRVTVPEETAYWARVALERMLALK